MDLMDDGRFYNVPGGEVRDIDQLKEEIEKLTIDHRYRFKDADTPFHGVVTNIDELKIKLTQLYLDGYTVSGFSWHCGTGLLVRDINKKAKVISIFVSSENQKHEMYLNYVLNFSDIDKFNKDITDGEIDEVRLLINSTFGKDIQRRGSDSDMWLEIKK